MKDDATHSAGLFGDQAPAEYTEAFKGKWHNEFFP